MKPQLRARQHAHNCRKWGVTVRTTNPLQTMMTSRFGFSICLAALLLFGLQSPAAADVDVDDDRDRNGVRLYGGLWLGFGGELEIDGRGPLGPINVSGRQLRKKFEAPLTL
jgi:hypothetical protein